jgi:hypothetical protein
MRCIAIHLSVSPVRGVEKLGGAWVAWLTAKALIQSASLEKNVNKP